MSSSHDCVSNPPSQPGTYCVQIQGIMTLVDIYWQYDGEFWDTGEWDYPLRAGDAFWFDN